MAILVASLLQHFDWGRDRLCLTIIKALSLSTIQHDLNKSKNEKVRKEVITILVQDKRVFLRKGQGEAKPK